MESGSLGKTYEDGEFIARQGEQGTCMYVIQSGQVAIVRETDGKEVELAVRNPGDFFGEMAIFERDVRVASARAVGQTRVLTIDKKNLLRRFQQDPSLAFRMVETMSNRIRELSEEVARFKGTD